MVIFTANIYMKFRVRLSHLRTVVHSWHQVVNVGSVRVLYAAINHHVVK